MTDCAITIRAETTADFASIRSVNAEAFGRRDEADLVDRLRADGDVVASLVAQRGEHLVGHILFSRLPILAEDREIAGAALAPVAVRPPVQRQGVGSALVRAGLRCCRDLDIEAVVVLGHPAYYPRFGFSATVARRLDAPFSGAAFMALALAPGVLDGGGAVRYPAAFGT